MGINVELTGDPFLLHPPLRRSLPSPPPTTSTLRELLFLLLTILPLASAHQGHPDHHSKTFSQIGIFSKNTLQSPCETSKAFLYVESLFARMMLRQVVVFAVFVIFSVFAVASLTGQCTWCPLSDHHGAVPMRTVNGSVCREC